jgi:hypothetical protein
MREIFRLAELLLASQELVSIHRMTVSCTAEGPVETYEGRSKFRRLAAVRRCDAEGGGDCYTKL